MITNFRTIFLFSILLSCFLLNGCSILVEDTWYIVDDLSGWKRIDITGFHTPQITATKIYSYEYEANESRVHIDTSRHSKLLSIGLLVPIIPIMASVDDDKLKLNVIYWPCEPKEDNIMVSLLLGNQNALIPKNNIRQKAKNTINYEILYDVSLLDIDEFKVIISSEKCIQSIPTLTFKRRSTLRYAPIG